MYWLVVCSLFACVPEPVVVVQTLEQCEAKAVELFVDGVKYQCLKK